jgi:hypothetical protein
MGNQDDEITPVPPAYDEKPSEAIHTVERVNTFDEDEETVEFIEPNDEQLGTLRRISEPIPLRAW